MTDEQEVAAAPMSAQQAQAQLVRTVPETLAPAWNVESQSDGHAVRMNGEVGGVVGNRSRKDSHCSFCRAELGEGLELSIPGSGKYGQRATTGCFCSTRCRDCVLALAALHPSPLASDDFISERGRLTDQLLDLWRQGRGPKPELVLQAARSADCGFPEA